jgi:hypothetical protein
MNNLQEFISFKFGEIDFDGVKLKWTDKGFPWENNKERRKYLYRLVNEGSDLSALRYKNLLAEMNKQEIQIKISWSFLVRLIGLILISFSLFFGIRGLSLLSGVLALASAGSFVFSVYFERRANELYAGLVTGSDLVDLMFEMEKNNGEISLDENF